MMEPLTDPAAAAALLTGWEQPMVWSYLSGRMGKGYADHAAAPRSVAVCVGDFTFLAGEENVALAACLPLQQRAFTIVVPRTPAWALCVETHCPRSKPVTRYAFAKHNSFDAARLRRFAACLPQGYLLGRMEEADYYAARQREWSRDLVSGYPDAAAYAAHGAGYAVWHGGALVCGASSYADWPGGIEIEIDCHPAHRRRGLARACAAALVLDCLARGLHPSWDAANAVSAHLAQTLGYTPADSYTAYEITK